MNEESCVNCKAKGYTMLNYLKKTKISTITDASDVDNIENMDKK